MSKLQVSDIPQDAPSLPKGWRYAPLSSLVDPQRGISYGVVQPGSFDPVGVPIIRVNNIKEGRLVVDDVLKVAKKIEDKHVRTRLRGREVVLTVAGTLGECAVVPNELAGWNVARAVAVIPISSQITPEWLAFCLRSNLLKHYIDSWAVTTVQPTFNLRDVGRLPIPIPPKHELLAIEGILSPIDEKIELNQEMNKNLEEIGKAIFRRWFIDFEFPNVDGKPYKSSGGEMVFNEDLGIETPEEWRIGKLGQFIDLDKGLSYKGEFLSEKGIPMINLGTMAPKAGFINEGMKYYIGDYKEKHLVRAGDIVIANTDLTQKREVLGSPAIVPPYLESDNVLFTHHIYAVRNNSFLPSLFIYYLLQLGEYRDRVIGFATGTTVLALPRDAILDYNFVVPDETVLQKFNHLASLLINRTNLCIEQDRTLSQLRDYLLPKLMSGKIRIPLEAN